MARRSTTVRLNELAARGWDRLTTRRNVTYNTVIEALGEALDSEPDIIPDRVIQRARELDRERRSRR